MLQEIKSTEAEAIQVLPNINLHNEAFCIPLKETIASCDGKVDKRKIMEPRNAEKLIPSVQTPEQMVPCGHHPVVTNIFPKTLDVPQVLQACQNYDFRYQRELLKSGVTLNLNPDDYLERGIGEDEAAFRMTCVKYMKNYYANRPQHSKETEEQAATRRAQNALRMRNYRQNLRVLETEQQAAERRAQNALRMRNYRRFKREVEPELAAKRRAQNAERMRNYRKVKRELEPEVAALRRAQNALRMRNYRKNKRPQSELK